MSKTLETSVVRVFSGNNRKFAIHTGLTFASAY